MEEARLLNTFLLYWNNRASRDVHIILWVENKTDLFIHWRTTVFSGSQGETAAGESTSSVNSLTDISSSVYGWRLMCREFDPLHSVDAA